MISRVWSVLALAVCIFSCGQENSTTDGSELRNRHKHHNQPGTCSNGLVSSDCTCGGTIVSTGYCCDNVAQFNACDPGVVVSPTITTQPGNTNTPTNTLTNTPTNTITSTLVEDIYVYSDIANDLAARSTFFSFAQEKGIQRVYLETAYLYDGSRTALMDLISDCADRHIQVTLLYGNANWALTANHQTAVQRAAQAVALASQIQASGKTAPDAVQFDVEPYLVSTWGTDLQGTSNQYLDLLDKLHTTLGGKLNLTVAIPFWFDGDMITRNGQTRPLSEWTIDATDSVVMMDYRNTASSILSSSSSEIAYAGSHGKIIVLAVDTETNAESASITFCADGEAVMKRELTTASTTLEKQNGFGGFAMFDYEYWKVLKP